MSEPAARVRAFLGVALDEDLRRALVRAARPLAAAPWARAVRWVDRDALHLTLHFLGERAPEELEAVSTRVAALAERHAAMRVPFTAVEVFPSPRRPRVIAALLEPVPALASLAAEVDAAVLACGLLGDARPAPPPRYRPHVTLGRVRGRLDGALRIEAPLAGSWLGVDAVTLFRSELRAKGSRYTVLARFVLAAAG